MPERRQNREQPPKLHHLLEHFPYGAAGGKGNRNGGKQNTSRQGNSQQPQILPYIGISQDGVSQLKKFPKTILWVFINAQTAPAKETPIRNAFSTINAIISSTGRTPKLFISV